MDGGQQSPDTDEQAAEQAVEPTLAALVVGQPAQAARGHQVVHLLRPGHVEPHRPWEPISETRDGVLYLCGEQVA